MTTIKLVFDRNANGYNVIVETPTNTITLRLETTKAKAMQIIAQEVYPVYRPAVINDPARNWGNAVSSYRLAQ